MHKPSDNKMDTVDHGRRRAVGMLAAAPFLIPRFAHAHKKKRLRIAQYTHFVPQYDEWFENEFVKQWGDANDTQVTIDRVGMTSLGSRARAEVEAGKGHDLFMFVRPPPMFEDQVIDHHEIYEECTRRFGKPLELATKSTYNPHTKRYFGFTDSYVPDPVNYRRDLWDGVAIKPDSWDAIRRGGAEIKRSTGVPVGLGLAPELDSNMTIRSIMLGFGASVQDAEGRLILDSRMTRDAVDFVTALYREAMTEEVFTWDPSSNNRMMLAGHGSLTLNAISVTRTGETQRIPIARRIALAPPAAGPVNRLGLMHLMHCYVIWKFAENIEGAKQFLVDYLGNFREAFLASKFYNFPCFPDTVPDLEQLVAKDPIAQPDDKYSVLATAADWTVSVGHPGFANAAIDEIYNRWVLSDMFAEAARGHSTTEEAVSKAVKRTEQIFEHWRAAGRLG